MPPPREAYGPPSGGDRLAGIDALLRAQRVQPSAPPPARLPQVARVSIPAPAAPLAAPAAAPRRYWVQLASGTDQNALGAQFDRIAQREPDQFKGIRPYVAEVGGRFKLLVGPFHSASDSTTFVEILSDAHIDGFSWTSPEGQAVRKLARP